MLKGSPLSADPMLPIKKSVSLAWNDVRLSFDVAQDLFSSHQVDMGSRRLLESLERLEVHESGQAADFGCGYGVLGIAWQTRWPNWSMDLIDRDALAVAFARHNAERSGVPSCQFFTDVMLPQRHGGYDCVLWNVPGKAGRTVISALRDQALDMLTEGGTLAIVVVNPLAILFTDPQGREEIAVDLVREGTEHTVVHLRRLSGAPRWHDGFEHGAFDREPREFQQGGLEWTLQPVVGLPEYDELGHPTEVAIAALQKVDVGSASRFLVVEPGVGHLARVAEMLCPEAHGVVVGRDALALRSTARSMEGTGHAYSEIWGLPAVSVVEPVDVVVAALPAQASESDIAAGLDALGQCVAPSGEVILHGRSTEIARAERVVRRRNGWRSSRPTKQRGFAAVAVRTALP